MKNRSFYLFFILVILGSCLAEQNNELLVGNCHDGILNQDETEIDCGGRCVECEVFIPVVTPCTLPNNTYTLGGSAVALATDDFVAWEDGDYYEVFIYESGRQLEVIFPSKPTEDKIYTATQSYYPEEGQACVFYIGSWYDQKSSAGDIYVHANEDGFVVEICSVTMVSAYLDPMELSLKVTWHE